MLISQETWPRVLPLNSPYFDFSAVFNHKVRLLMTKRKTYNYDASLIENRQIAANLCHVDFNSVAYPLQTHSNGVSWVDKTGAVANVDGLITRSSHVNLSLQVADCVPIFVYDMKKNTRGLIHAGWKGMTSSICRMLVEQFEREGADLNDLIVYLGPAICQDHYEIGIDVAKKFHEHSLKKTQESVFADLRTELTTQLLILGVPSENIQVSSICTYEDPDCCSYRGAKDSAGRMFAFMGNI